MDSTTGLDFSGQSLEEPDFSNSRLHNGNFENARITGAWLHNADIDGYIGGLKINGVEVARLIDKELNRLYPERGKLRADNPSTLAAAWAIIEDLWQATVDRAKALPEPLLDERVNGEWSFVETLRHLIFATDAWLLFMVKREPRPYHPWGLPHTEFREGPKLGVDESASPSLEEVLQVRRQRMATVKELIANVDSKDLERHAEPPDEAGYPQRSETVQTCFRIILDEEWAHNLYANRDLGILEARLRAESAGSQEANR